VSFALPRAAVIADVLTTHGPAQAGEVFVMERVPQHDGPESVLEMLNRPEAFFAFRPAEPAPDEEVLLVSKAHTVSVAQQRQAPIADPARLSAAKLLGLELVFADGTKLNGWASVELPPEHSRVLDYLNASPDAFIALWTHASTHYVNRAHVLYARPLE
jgi:hypothetical protein